MAKRAQRVTEATCPLTPEPTELQREDIAEIAEAGGTLAVEEYAHTAAFAYVAGAHTRKRAEAWIATERDNGKWLDAHAHDDGRIYVPRP